jgi:hypothetical protein
MAVGVADADSSMEERSEEEEAWEGQSSTEEVTRSGPMTTKLGDDSENQVKSK